MYCDGHVTKLKQTKIFYGRRKEINIFPTVRYFTNVQRIQNPTLHPVSDMHTHRNKN